MKALGTGSDGSVYASAISDAAGVPRLWSELPKIERNRFCTTHFACATIRSWAEQELRLAYDLRAFGGTRHTEDQRALPDAGIATAGG